jgi:hypothetical protein
MLEPWHNWHETLGSAEVLAIVIVFVVAGAGVITLAQGRAKQTSLGTSSRLVVRTWMGPPP